MSGSSPASCSRTAVTSTCTACSRPRRRGRRRQQERFDRFRDEYNLVHPHEALAQRTPANAHARSAREYPERVPDPEYPLHWERRRVRRDGSLKFQGRQPHLSEALTGEAVGLVEGEEDLWQIGFCD